MPMENSTELFEASLAHHERLAAVEGDLDCRYAQLFDSGCQKARCLLDDVTAEECRITSVAIISALEEVAIGASQIADFRDLQDDVDYVDSVHG
jgi:hypothetical protein